MYLSEVFIIWLRAKKMSCYLKEFERTLELSVFAAGIQSHVKQKRARSTGAKNKAVINLYNKLTDLIGTMSELIDIQQLTDTIILQVSEKLLQENM